MTTTDKGRTDRQRDNGSDGGDADHDRDAAKRAQYLARTTDIDLADRQARALAYREQGDAHAAIARKVGVAPATVTGWLERIAARYGPEAIETKPPEQRGDLVGMTVDRLEQYAPAVREQYREIAVEHPDVTPDDVLNELASDAAGDGEGEGEP